MSSATDKTVTVSFDPNAINIQTDIIQGATTTKAGAMTAAQVTQLNNADATSSAAAAAAAAAQTTADSALAIAEDAIAQANDVLYVNATTGNDADNGLTPGTALATFDKAISLIAAQYRQFTQINFAAGDYTWPTTKRNIFLGKAVGNQATPLALVGELADQLGVCTILAGTTSSVLNFTPTTPIRSGATGSFIAGAPAGFIRFTDPALVTAPTDVDRILLLGNGASSTNNGPFTIATVVGPNTVDLVNAQGVVADANNGAITWQESFEGCYVRFDDNTTTVALRGTARQIRANGSTTQVTMASAFGAVPVAGDTFSVQRPASTIHYGAAGEAASVAYVLDSGTLGLQAMKFKRDAGSSGLTFRLIQSQFESVWFQNGVLLATNYTVLPAGQGSAVSQWSNQTATSPFSTNRTGCGMFLQDISTGVMLTQHCRVVGTVVAINTTLVQSPDSFWGATTWGDRVSVTVTGGEFAPAGGSINKQQVQSATTGIVTSQMVGTVTLPTGFDVSNSGGYGVDLQNGSEGRLAGVTGTNNTKTGVRVDHRSGASINSPSGATSVTGLTGDVEFGHTTVPDIQTYVTINTADGNGVKGFQDTYGNRVDAN